MKFDASKTARQIQSIEKVEKNNGIGCIVACMQFGKTKIGTMYIERVRHQDAKYPIIVLTPSDIVRRQWDKQVNTDKVLILTINKAKDLLSELLKVSAFALLVVDEIHKFTTDQNIEVLKGLSGISKRRLGLTGTYPNNYTISNLFPIVDRISETEALENNWISQFSEYNIPVSLTAEEKIKYIKFSKPIQETMELFRGKARQLDPKHQAVRDDLDLIYSCYSGKKIRNVGYIHGERFRNGLAKLMGWSNNMDLTTEYNQQREQYWSPNNLYERCKQFKQFVERRNELLINNENKLKIIQEIIETNDVPTIIFNESTEFVNTIADELGDKAIPYHSNIKSRPMIDKETGQVIKFKTGKVKMFGPVTLKNMAIEGIKSGEYKYLVTAKALDEGLNLPELEQVIITAGSSNPIQQLQRSGRAKAIDENNLSKITRIFNLYIDDFIDETGETIKSRDKSKLVERQKSYSHPVKWINDLSELDHAN